MGLWAWVARWRERLFPGKPLGRRGEEAAARFLRSRGYQILAQDDRSRSGEIDLVAVDHGTVVFVEVKTRRTADMGHPTAAITPEKEQRLTRAAVTWLKRHGLLECGARFDVVAVIWPEGVSKPTIEHFRDAFPAAGVGGFFS
jgi:putative endonuclease